MTARLLDPGFLRELEALRRMLGVRARSGLSGAVTSARRGSAAEFAEHRSYAPGDDVARIDWLAYARTGQPVVKQHRSDEDTVVRLVVDASRSLDFGTPRKLDVAIRIAAAIAYLALASSERAQLIVATGDENGTHARPTAPRRGRAALAEVLGELSRVEARGAVDLVEALRRALAAAARPGLLVIVSDFLDPGPVEDALRRARFADHDLALVQVLAPEELAPTLEGDLALVDSETNATVELTADAASIEAYLARLDGLFESLRAFARSAGAIYVRASTADELGGVLRRFVGRAVD